MPLPVYQHGLAEAYVQTKGWRYKCAGDELVIETCPFCAKGGWKFYLNNAKGAYSCKYGSCSSQGNFYQLTKAFGDAEEFIKPLASQPKAQPARKRYSLTDLLKYEVALETDDEAQAYLKGRGITMDTAKAWHLGVKQDKDNVKWLLIPYIQGNEILDVKYRTLPPADKRFQRLGGGESILFGQHLLQKTGKSKDRPLYMVEGELDAVTMWQQGFVPVISTTTGAGSFKTEWYDSIAAYDPTSIVVCYDSDIAGQKAAQKIVQKFEEEGRRVVNIVLPGAKDANEYFLTHSRDDFDALITAVPEPGMENCHSMSEVLDMLEEQLWFSTDHFDGLPSQFTDVNAMIAGGYWNGQLITLSGVSGTGKTSYVLQELLWHAKNGNPTYMLCLEMPETMMMRKLIEKEFNVPMLKITQEHVQRYRKQLEKWPIYFGNKGRDLDEVERTIRAAVKRYDLKLVAFDNLNYFVRSIDNVTQEIARVTKRFKEIAVDLHIPIILIAQPRKFDDDTRTMRASDLKDSSAIQQDSDVIILLHRRPVRTEMKDLAKGAATTFTNQSPYTLVRVEKARYSSGGDTFLYFDGARSTYRELTPGEMEGLKQ